MSQLDDLVIAAPCPVSWESMPGNDRIRHCSQCSRNIYNISDMTAKEAEQFLKQNGSSQCVRLFRRADGKLMTDNCPVGLRAIRNKCLFIAKIAAGFIASFVAFVPSVMSQTASSGANLSKVVTGKLSRVARTMEGPEETASNRNNAAEETPAIGAQDPALRRIRAFSPTGWPFDGRSNWGNDVPKKQVMLGSDDMCNPQPLQYRHTVHMGKSSVIRSPAAATVSAGSFLPAGQQAQVMEGINPSWNSGTAADAPANSGMSQEGSFGTQSIESNQTEALENRNADWKIHHLFAKGKSFESNGQFVLAISCWKSALSACDSSPNTDPNFRSIIEEHLKNLSTRMSRGQ